MKNAAAKTAKATDHARAARAAATLILETLNGKRAWDDAEVFAAAKVLESAGCYVRRNVCA